MTNAYVKWIVCPECQGASYLIFEHNKLIKQACENDMPLVSEY